MALILLERVRSVFSCKKDRGRPVNEELITKGDPTHNHRLEKADWDSRRFGPDVTDMSEYYACYKYLFRCECGTEIIQKNWALI